MAVPRTYLRPLETPERLALKPFEAMWDLDPSYSLSRLGGLFETYQLLSKRLSISIPRFERQQEAELLGKSVAVVGAGPIGLRLALEASLLGAQVQVFDARGSFTRMNILKLWDWASHDLLELGAKHLLPNFLSYVALWREEQQMLGLDRSKED